MARILKQETTKLRLDGEATAQLKAFVRGEVTWAQVEGMTFEEARAIAQVGCELAAAGRLEEARVLFEGLTQGNPQDAASRAALGTVYQQLGRIEEALAQYALALEQDPRNPVALANRGELRLKAGDKHGFADLARALEADPQGESAASRRATALVNAIGMQVEEAAKSSK